MSTAANQGRASPERNRCHTQTSVMPNVSMHPLTKYQTT